MRLLMKYELRKTWFIKVILLALTAAAELAFLGGMWADRDGLMVTGIVLLTMLATGGTMVIGLATVVVLHRDMNTKQSHMLFMTPNSSYKILGAKVLENGISILLTGAFYFALGALDITLLFAHEKALDQLWDMISQLLRSFNEELTISAPQLGALVWMMAASWFCMVVTGCLADVIISSLLNGQRFSGLVAILAYLALNAGLQWLARVILGWFGHLELTLMLTLDGVIMMVFAILMYWAAAAIMERRLSV